jgi:hypothetical protein
MFDTTRARCNYRAGITGRGESADGKTAGPRLVPRVLMAGRAQHSAVTLDQNAKRPGFERSQNELSEATVDGQLEDGSRIARWSSEFWRDPKVFSACCTASSFVSNGPRIAAFRLRMIVSLAQYQPIEVWSAFPKNTPTPDGTLDIHASNILPADVAFVPTSQHRVIPPLKGVSIWVRRGPDLSICPKHARHLAILTGDRLGRLPFDHHPYKRRDLCAVSASSIQTSARFNSLVFAVEDDVY